MNKTVLTINQQIQTCTRLLLGAEIVSKTISEELSQHSLTISQFNVLEALYHNRPLNQREIGQKIYKSPGNITMIVDNLVKHGLVERKRDSSDRRYYSIHLTKKGKKLVPEVSLSYQKVIELQFSVLSTKEQKQLGKICKKLIKSTS